jgi:hypothetical protein
MARDPIGDGGTMGARVLIAAAIAIVLVSAPDPRAAQSEAIAVTTTPDGVSVGDVFLLEADCGCQAVSGSLKTSLLDRPVPLFREPGATRWRAVLGVDLETTPGPYGITVSFPRLDGPALSTTHTVHVSGRQFPTRRLRVAPAFVNPPPEVEQRIIDEAARLRTVMAPATDWALLGPLQPPVPATVNSNFGSRSVFNGQPRSPHAGVDFPGAVGDAVAAPAAGRVVLAGDLYFTGQTVVLDHGQGLFSVLAHLSEIVVPEGSGVERGAVVGKVGATGRVTGPHLHWSVRLHGARVDPLSVLRLLAAE